MTQQSQQFQQVQIETKQMAALIAAILASGTASPGASVEVVMERYLDFCRRFSLPVPDSKR